MDKQYAPYWLNSAEFDVELEFGYELSWGFGEGHGRGRCTSDCALRRVLTTSYMEPTQIYA